MRNLEIILEDKKRNDVLLAQAQKKDAELKAELDELYVAVATAVGK